MQFVFIDPQRDFCEKTGSLYVPGAEKDIERLADLVSRLAHVVDDIHVTLDTHHVLDVAHPIFWVDEKGAHPAPFTQITKDDVLNGKWRPFNPTLPCPPYGTLMDRMIDYVTKLEQGGKYQLTIWPPHCLIGRPGHNIAEPLGEALQKWESSRYAMVNYVTKGSNIFTEHYSAVQADVPDPSDPTTSLNIGLIQVVETADTIVFAGEASTHCVYNSIYDMIANFGEETIKKLVILTDCMSPVPGYEHIADKMFKDLSAKGVRLARASDL
jgi:nicotinamidase/pyrazinamidase